MAGDWLKFEANTPEKKEVFAITVALGWDDPDLTVGKLLKVWRWFDQQTINGNAVGVTPALLDRLIGVTGLTQAMANVGWLCINSDGLSLPNFERHNGKTAKDRALTAKRVASHKALKDGNDKGNADSVSEALPREEKRREENTVVTNSVCNTTVPSVSTASSTLKGEIGKALTQLRLPPFNLQNPKLDLAIEAGATAEEFTQTAIEIRQKDPSKFNFDYLLAVVIKRRQDAKAMPAMQKGAHKPPANVAAKSIFKSQAPAEIEVYDAKQITA